MQLAGGHNLLPSPIVNSAAGTRPVGTVADEIGLRLVCTSEVAS